MAAISLKLHLGMLTCLLLLWTTEAKNVPKQNAANENAVPVSKEDADCPPYNYCVGENFPNRVKVKDYVIQCDQEENIRGRCCLPSSEHLVCYDIRVEGSLLNHSEDILISTDFTALCREMLETAGRQASRYQSAALRAEGGDMAFVYNQWVTGIQGKENDTHIRHLACGTDGE